MAICCSIFAQAEECKNALNYMVIHFALYSKLAVSQLKQNCYFGKWNYGHWSITPSSVDSGRCEINLLRSCLIWPTLECCLMKLSMPLFSSTKQKGKERTENSKRRQRKEEIKETASFIKTCIGMPELQDQLQQLPCTK